MKTNEDLIMEKLTRIARAVQEIIRLEKMLVRALEEKKSEQKRAA